jgi:hypothetical protein
MVADDEGDEGEDSHDKARSPPANKALRRFMLQVPSAVACAQDSASVCRESHNFQSAEAWLPASARRLVAAANLWIASRRLPPEGGSHTCAEFWLPFLQRQRGFRLQPEGWWLSPTYGSPHAAFRLKAEATPALNVGCSSSSVSVASAFSRKAAAVANLWIASRSLPPEGGSHTCAECRLQFLQRQRGFRLQPEGGGCRQSMDRLTQPSA